MLKKFFGRRKRRRIENDMLNTNEETFKKVFPVGDITPLDYEFSEKFVRDGKDPLSEERKLIRNAPVDWLLQDKRTAAIKADSLEEMSFARRQYFKHICAVESIARIQHGNEVVAEEKLQQIEEEIASYEKRINELEALRNKKEGGKKHETY